MKPLSATESANFLLYLDRTAKVPLKVTSQEKKPAGPPQTDGPPKQDDAVNISFSSDGSSTPAPAQGSTAPADPAVSPQQEVLPYVGGVEQAAADHNLSVSKTGGVAQFEGTPSMEPIVGPPGENRDMILRALELAAEFKEGGWNPGLSNARELDPGDARLNLRFHNDMALALASVDNRALEGGSLIYFKGEGKDQNLNPGQVKLVNENPRNQGAFQAQFDGSGNLILDEMPGITTVDATRHGDGGQVEHLTIGVLRNGETYLNYQSLNPENPSGSYAIDLPPETLASMPAHIAGGSGQASGSGAVKK